MLLWTSPLVKDVSGNQWIEGRMLLNIFQCTEECLSHQRMARSKMSLVQKMESSHKWPLGISAFLNSLVGYGWGVSGLNNPQILSPSPKILWFCGSNIILASFMFYIIRFQFSFLICSFLKALHKIPKMKTHDRSLFSDKAFALLNILWASCPSSLFKHVASK